MKRSVLSQLVLITALLSAVGCASPLRLTVRFPHPAAYASYGPEVRVLPILSIVPALGYHPETPPALVVQRALGEELARRGLSKAERGLYEVGCRMPQLKLRYRDYAGGYSATDGWGYLDLFCQVRSAGQIVWKGPIYSRYHKAFYFFGINAEEIEGTLWPELMGPLIQQAAAILNRVVFRQSPARGSVEEGLRLLSSENADKRFLGAYILGIIGDSSVVGPLMQHLDDPEKKVRRSVVDALGTLGAAEVLPALLARFDQEDGNVQWAILKSILQFGIPAGFSWLRERIPSLTSEALGEIADDVLHHEPAGQVLSGR